MKEEQLLDNPFIAWCVDCKEPINADDEYVKTKKGVFCLECYHEINGIVPELDFDQE